MKNLALVLLLLMGSLAGVAQPSDEASIRNILQEQIDAWNQADLNQFMKGYWQSDSLMFIGKNGLTYGYSNALNNYNKSYPDSSAMGKLHFDILRVDRLSPEYYFVIGKWMLTRSAGNLQGHYTLIFKKINGQWKIISDHSS